MLIEKNLLSLLYLGTKQRHANNKRRANAHKSAIAQASREIPGYNRKRSARNTQNLISMLLGYGNRAARASKPYTSISMDVYSPNGRKAVRLKMRKQAG